MRLTFHGTLSSIEKGNARHARQSLLEVAHGGRSLLIDCGGDWLEGLPVPDPIALLVTHAHPDHVGGLAHGAPCPVYADAASWERIDGYPLRRRVLIRPRHPFYVAGIRCEAFALQHSPRAPAVGYRLQAGRASVFYCPDVAAIPEPRRALGGVRLYIGDGASFAQPLLRLEHGMLYGHAPIPDQLQWCAEHRVPRMLVSHCGEEIVADENRIACRLRERARRVGVEAGIAYDGLTIRLP